MNLRRTLSGLIAAALLSTLVYAILAALTDVSAVMTALRDFPASTFAAMVALTLGCYAMRAVRWKYLTNVVGAPMRWRDAFYVQFSGMTMTVTPGKVGEVLKAYLGRHYVGLAMSKGISLVFCERLADLIAVIVLSVGGLSLLGGGVLGLALGAIVVAFGVVILSSERAHTFVLAYDRQAAMGEEAPRLCGRHVRDDQGHPGSGSAADLGSPSGGRLGT